MNVGTSTRKPGTRSAATVQRTLVLVLLLTIGLIGCTQTQAPSPTPTLAPTPTQTRVPSPTTTLAPTPTQPLPLATWVPTPTLSLPGKPVTDPAGPVTTVEAGKKIVIWASAAGAYSYEWKLQGAGNLSLTSGDATLYTAPEGGDGVAIVTVTAHNDQGASPPTSLALNIQTLATVRLDALAILPVSWVQDRGNAESFISGKVSRGSRLEGSTCLQFTYEVGARVGGASWSPMCEEGTCAVAVNILEAGNLGTVKRLTFWARGERGREIIVFRVGGPDVSPKPGRSIRVTLSRFWQSYEITLENMDLTNAIALFAWFATDIDNPQGAVFYLDDIQFEGVKK